MEEERRGHGHSLYWLWEAGLRFGGAIDVGCADGHFMVQLAEAGPLRGATLLNVDAQEDYKASLEAIKAELGGHYAICAVGERDGGTVELQRGAHAYWSSIRPSGDGYWARHNALHAAQRVQVPVRTLDGLVAETSLPAPYFLKMDIQGAEQAAIAGARSMLRRTDVVIVEMLLDDFTGIHAALVDNGLALFDLVDLEYTHAGVLGWFYAVYIRAALQAQLPKPFWDPAENEFVVGQQLQRRDSVREMLSESLRRHRTGRWPKL